jgi:hypothetical protein
MLTDEAEEVARMALEAGRPCLELCIRHLQKTLREAAASQLLLAGALPVDAEGADAGGEKGGGGGASVSNRREKMLASKQGLEEQLPCPRYSGAVFTGVGSLLCFNCTLVGGPAADEDPAGGAEGGRGSG